MFYCATGKMAGDGNNGRTLNVWSKGVAPSIFYIKPTNTTANGGALTWDGLGAGIAFDPTKAPSPTTGFITSLDVDGVTLSADDNVNALGTDYDWIAIYADSTYFSSGTYSGTGAGGNVISVPNLMEWGFIKRMGSQAGVQYTHHNGRTKPFASTNPATSLVGNVTSSQFELLSGSSIVNTAGTNNYKYFCLSFPSGLAYGGNYTATGTDDDAITTPNFPVTAIILSGRSGARSPVMAGSHQSTGDSLVMATSLANISDGIKTFTPLGFTMGQDNLVNSTGTIYDYIVFGDEAIIPPAGAGRTPNVQARISATNRNKIAQTRLSASGRTLI